MCMLEKVKIAVQELVTGESKERKELERKHPFREYVNNY